MVVVCLNSASTVAYPLESFLAQDHPDKELVIVDGGSTDGTLATIKNYGLAENAIVVSEPDNGIYDAMNKGLKTFTGDAVGFLNSDDRFTDRTSLSTIAAALEDADMVHGDLDFVASHKGGRVVRRWRARDFRPGAFRRGWMPAHPTFYVRRKVVNTVGPFDTSYGLAADYDYMLRAVELNAFRLRRIERVLVNMQHGGASTAGLRAYLRSNFESHRSRCARLGIRPFDIRALLAKPLRKLPQLLT